MGMALNKSTDGGATFQQVSVDVADYTLGGTTIVATMFQSVKDANNNTYIYCFGSGTAGHLAKLIAISATGVKKVCTLNWYQSANTTNGDMIMSRDGNYLFFISTDSNANKNVYKMPIADIVDGCILPAPTFAIGTGSSSVAKFAIYKDQYIWVASGTTVKIYDYDTKAELASRTVANTTGAIVCDKDNNLYRIEFYLAGDYRAKINRLTFDGISNISAPYDITGSIGLYNYEKQLLIDRFGDLIILTNTGTSSTLLKYSNTGTLIDNISLSVGTNKGAYGLQVYSKDNGTKCWVQFSNDLGTWRTEAKSYDATPANRTFGAVSKIRDNGVTVYGDDHGGDNNYSVRC